MSLRDEIEADPGRAMAALATSIAEAPGVYALLLGSGISQGAGIPTGWGVATTLASKIAAADGVTLDPEAGATVERWWYDRTGQNITYSGLLHEVAPTPGHRQQVLRHFFEETSDGRPATPSKAHHRIAELVAEGYIRLIITTNFDRLMEDALGAKGINPQVIRTSGDVNGMIPLVQRGVTIIKLHGDFMSLDMRNSELELTSYPPPLSDLLSRILDEFGLVIMGWSGRWDHALRQALRSTANQRYPSWWATPEELGVEAKTITASNDVRVIRIHDADSWADDLMTRVHLAADVRRPRPRLLRAGDPPEIDRQSPRRGWVDMPLLQVELTCRWAPIDGSAIIRAEEREALLAVLDDSPLSKALIAASDLYGPRRSRLDETEPAGLIKPPEAWIEPPNGFQSTVTMTYRWGTDGSAGVTALATVEGLVHGSGNRWSARVRLGLSTIDPVRLTSLARLIRLGFDLALQIVRGMPELVGWQDVGCTLSCAIGASQQEDRARGGVVDVPGALEGMLTIDELGTRPTREIRNAMGFAYDVPMDVTSDEVADVAARGIEYMAYANGWTDPRDAIGHIRRELGPRPTSSGDGT